MGDLGTNRRRRDCRGNAVQDAIDKEIHSEEDELVIDESKRTVNNPDKDDSEENRKVERERGRSDRWKRRKHRHRGR